MQWWHGGKQNSIVGTCASAIIECQEDSGDEPSPGIAAVAIDGNIAERSSISCARHFIG